jgi:hypothetical protein
MTQAFSFINEHPGSWQLFGEIELPAGSTNGHFIGAWLEETLRPLHLNNRLLNTIIASAAEAVDGGSAEQTADDGTAALAVGVPMETDFEPLQLRIYVFDDSLSSGKSWGFFRVEKKGDTLSPAGRRERAIAFYLYREGMG